MSSSGKSCLKLALVMPFAKVIILRQDAACSNTIEAAQSGNPVLTFLTAVEVAAMYFNVTSCEIGYCGPIVIGLFLQYEYDLSGKSSAR